MNFVTQQLIGYHDRVRQTYGPHHWGVQERQSLIKKRVFDEMHVFDAALHPERRIVMKNDVFICPVNEPRAVESNVCTIFDDFDAVEYIAHVLSFNGKDQHERLDMGLPWGCQGGNRDNKKRENNAMGN